MAQSGEQGFARRSRGMPGRDHFIVAQRFRMEERLGSGAFGEVFRGHDLKTGRLVAFKVEPNKDGCRSHLLFEQKVYRRLNECSITVGVPQVYFCGTAGEYTVMVMDLLGPCLEELFTVCQSRFSVKTVCMLGIQIVERLQYMHSCGYLHRDIKPENFVMGMGSRSHVVYIIDVGLTKAWRESNGKHIPYSDGRSLVGTARYVSINTHDGKQQSRRDDLESVTYLLMYFLRGRLPWQGLRRAKDDVRYSTIRKAKAATTPAMLAEGFPGEFASLVEYARSLEFAQEPNYSYCTQLLFNAMGNAEIDYHYQWNLNAATDDSACDAVRGVETDQRHYSRNSTMIATDGDSSMILDSSYTGNGLESSTVQGFPQQLPSINTSYSNFLEDMQDTFGLSDYY